MDPNRFFTTKTEKGVASMGVGVLFGPKDNVRSCGVKVIGASMKVSASKGELVKTFSIELTEEDEKGVVVVNVFDTNGQETALAIGVKKEMEKIKILMAELFVPESGRLGQIYASGRIEVIVDNIVYTNDLPKNFSEPHPEYRLVDGDNLCRYMVGIVDKDQLEKASTEHVAALTQAEYIIKLQNKITDMHVENGELRTEISDLMVEKQNLNEKIGEQKKGEAILVAILDELVWRLRDATIGKNRKFFLRTLRNSVKDFIESYNKTCWRFPNKDLR